MGANCSSDANCQSAADWVCRSPRRGRQESHSPGGTRSIWLASRNFSADGGNNRARQPSQDGHGLGSVINHILPECFNQDNQDSDDFDCLAVPYIAGHSSAIRQTLLEGLRGCSERRMLEGCNESSVYVCRDSPMAPKERQGSSSVKDQEPEAIGGPPDADAMREGQWRGDQRRSEGKLLAAEEPDSNVKFVSGSRYSPVVGENVTLDRGSWDRDVISQGCPDHRLHLQGYLEGGHLHGCLEDRHGGAHYERNPEDGRGSAAGGYQALRQDSQVSDVQGFQTATGSGTGALSRGCKKSHDIACQTQVVSDVPSYQVRTADDGAGSAAVGFQTQIYQTSLSLGFTQSHNEYFRNSLAIEQHARPSANQHSPPLSSRSHYDGGQCSQDSTVVGCHTPSKTSQSPYTNSSHAPSQGGQGVEHGSHAVHGQSLPNPPCQAPQEGHPPWEAGRAPTTSALGVRTHQGAPAAAPGAGAQHRNSSPPIRSCPARIIRSSSLRSSSPPVRSGSSILSGQANREGRQASPPPLKAMTRSLDARTTWKLADASSDAMATCKLMNVDSEATLDADATYEGQWKDHKKHGTGRLFCLDGSSYKGQFLADQKHGRGKFTYPDGSSFCGQWAEDHQHGYGIEHLADGSHFEGQFHYGDKSGKGRFTSGTGAKYEGCFVNNCMHGEGCYRWSDGRGYTGQWEYNRPGPRGTMTWPDGRRYNGGFLAGKRHGEAQLSWPQGLSERARQHGQDPGTAKVLSRRSLWEFGKFVQWVDGPQEQKEDSGPVY